MCRFQFRHLLFLSIIVSFFLSNNVVDSKKKTGKKKKKNRRRPGNSNASVKYNAAAIDKIIGMCNEQRQQLKKTRAVVRQVTWLLQASGETALVMSTTPQHRAACWMLYEDGRSWKKQRRLQSSSREKRAGTGRSGSRTRFLQRYALATLHYASTAGNTTAWDWKMAADVPLAVQKQHGHWLSPVHDECKWYGVKCDTSLAGWFFFWQQRRSVVVGLDLGFLKVDGILPRELGLLSDLKELDLHGNDLQGVLPHKMLDGLRSMEFLRLHMNNFFGAVHREIVAMETLRELHIFGNFMAGSIPDQIGQLGQLEVIDFYANQLSGTVPSSLGDLHKLRFLDVHDNNLTGKMPAEVCELRYSGNLKELIADCLGPKAEVECKCCTTCCRGLPDFKCVDMVTGKE